MAFRSFVWTVFLLAFIPVIASAQINPASSSQAAAIHGQVRFGDGRPAMLGIGVSLEQRGGGSAGETQADRDGKFSFSQLVPDLYTITVRMPGYLDAKEDVDLRLVRMSYVNIVLRPDPRHQGTQAPSSGVVSALDAAAPDDARKNFETGRDMLTQGKDIAGSISYFEKAIATYPKYPQAYLMLGLAYSAQKNWAESEKAIQKSLELNKDNAAALVALGADKNEQDKYDDAVKYLSQAVLLAPESADAHFELGRAYFGLQRWADADPHVAQANKLRPDNAGQHVLMGNIYLRERNAQAALQEYKEAVRVDPQGSWAKPAQQMVDKIEAALANAKK